MRRLVLVLAATVVAALGVSFARSRPARRGAARATPAARPPSPVTAERLRWPEPGPEPAPPAEVAGRAEPRYYHGTVVDGVTGAPLKGATVRLCSRPASGSVSCGESLASVESEEDGYFVLERARDDTDADEGERREVVRGPLVLEAEAERYGPVVVAPSEGQRRTGVELALRAEARVTGRLLLRSGGTPDHAEYGWRRPGGEPEAPQLSFDGSFEIRGLPEGEAVIHAVSGARGARGWAGAARVWLRAGETRSLDLVLDETVYTVSGRLVDAQGRPVALAKVAASPEREGDVEALLASFREDASTGFDGRFSLEFAGLGPHRVGFRMDPDREQVEVAVASLVARPLMPGEDASPDEVRVTRSDLVACTLLDSGGRAAGVTGGSVRTPGGGWGWASCGGGGESARKTVHFLWPSAAGPVTVRLGGFVGEGSVTLRTSADRCEVAARPYAPAAER